MKSLSFCFQKKSILFRFFACLFLNGIWIGGWDLPRLFLGEILLFMALLVIGFEWSRKKICQYLFVLCMGILVSQFHLFASPPFSLVSLVGVPLELRGEVTSFPQIRSKDTTVFLAVKEVRRPENNWQKIIGKTLLTIRRTQPVLDYGDELLIEGQLILPGSQQSFDYQRYLARYDIDTLLSFPAKITGTGSRGGHPVIRKAKQVRNYLQSSLENVLPHEHSIIATGVLLGIKQKLPEPVATWMQEAGLQHILVVSGSNVSILFFLLLFLFRRFGRRLLFLIAGGSLIFFVLMTGADPPVVRAAILGGMVLLAQQIGRFPDTRNSVLLAAVLMSVFDPKILSDLSFWLSVSAFLGIILLLPVLYKILWFLPEWLRLPIGVPLAAQMSVLPFILFYFGSFPIAGLFTNIVLEPLIPLIMVLSAVVAFLGFLPAAIGSVLAFPVYVLIEIVFWVAKLSQGTLTSSPDWFPILWGSFIGGFFVWALFSKYYEEHFLRPFEQRYL